MERIEGTASGHLAAGWGFLPGAVPPYRGWGLRAARARPAAGGFEVLHGGEELPAAAFTDTDVIVWFLARKAA